MIRSDSIFLISDTHHKQGIPCQDYALNFDNDVASCVIISDGCSSSNNTDIGSRHLVLEAKKSITKLQNFNNKTLALDIIQSKTLTYGKELGLAPNYLDATLNVIYANKEKAFGIIYGDGYVIAVDKQDNITIHSVEWYNNTPGYLNYLIDYTRLQTFLKLQENGGVTIKTINNNSIKENTITANEALYGIQFDFDINNLKYLIVASDGINAIDTYDLNNAVNEMIAYKSTTGLFLKRRVLFFLKNLKNSRGLLDDLSVGTILFE